ncbi:GntR family transcriptional regulator [Cereibacter sp. SYSU M97828]|nr:GntR family transcriptional regulator [Cereibacter flavus]
MAERLFHQLFEAILQGELAPGSKISEPLLAQKYSVSRGPLREALHRLQERHLITRSANHGSRVAEATPASLSELFKVREMLESLAAREAALNCTAEDLMTLQSMVDLHEARILGTAPERQTGLSSVDRDFHFLIAQRSNNPFLIRLLCHELYPLLRLYRSKYRNTDYRKRALLEHRRILGALEDKDPDMAEMMMRRHIAGARERRLETMGDDGSAQPKRRAKRADVQR